MALRLTQNYKLIIEDAKRISGKIKLSLLKKLLIGTIRMINYQQRMMTSFIGGD